MSERNEGDVEEKGRKRNESLRTKQALGKSGRWLFLFLILVQNWLCVNAAAEGLQKRTECIDAAAGRLEPEWEAEVLDIIIVSVAVRGTTVDIDGKDFQEKQMEKLPRKWNGQKELTGLKRERKNRG